MLSKSENKSSSSLSIAKSSVDSNAKLRIFSSNDKYIDVSLYNFIDKDTFYIKDKTMYSQLKHFFSGEFFKFVDKLSNDEYLSFLQVKDMSEFDIG